MPSTMTRPLLVLLSLAVVGCSHPLAPVATAQTHTGTWAGDWTITACRGNDGAETPNCGLFPVGLVFSRDRSQSLRLTLTQTDAALGGSLELAITNGGANAFTPAYGTPVTVVGGIPASGAFTVTGERSWHDSLCQTDALFKLLSWNARQTPGGVLEGALTFAARTRLSSCYYTDVIVSGHFANVTRGN
jgi:hypothetical protein